MQKNEKGQIVRDLLTGQRFGTVTVGEWSERQSNGGTKWFYTCDCGVTGWAWAEVLKRNPNFCCPQCRKKVIRKARTTHGGKYTQLYRVWSGMINRCFNPNNSSFHRYGGRGITVCDGWRGETGFETFRREMGEPPFFGATIERKNNNGNYYAGNCVWATVKQQANNRSTNQTLTFQGETLTWSQWSQKLGIDKTLIRQRAKKGWPVERVLSTERF